MSNDIAIRVGEVCKAFRGEIALDHVCVSFEKGKIHGIVGRNGSGKTVLMKCMLGFLRPDSGEIEVLGQRIGRDCDFPGDTGMMIETPGFLPGESALSNLKSLAALKSKPDVEGIREVIRLVGLDPASKKPVGKYSMGMRQRLGIAQALMEGPQLLVLDEPMNALDQQGVAHMRELLLSMKAQGKTIVMTSHFAQDIDALCDTVLHMERGRITQASFPLK